ncbi:response regulator transcription factor [Chloroflexota bacterium]
MPIIILSARNQKINIVRGLELGTDDYITKLFDHIKFLVRVKLVLRRTSIPRFSRSTRPFQNGKLCIDFNAHEVSLNREIAKLVPIEYNLLWYLVQNADNIMTHHALLEKVWDPEYTNDTDYLKVYIQRLRAKLGDNHNASRLMLTEWRVGYKLVKYS